MTGKITGLGAYLPDNVLTNDDLEKMVETNDEWITERTGIRRRHIADGVEDKSATMACKAALAAIEDAGIVLGEAIKKAVGDKVKNGDEIGTADSTAGGESADGKHLHFALLENGKKIDPANYLEFEVK